MDKIKEILSNYDSDNYGLFKNTVDMLCSKGIGGGCYQDYTVLCDVLAILTECEKIIKNTEA